MASGQALEWQVLMERELASVSKHDVHELLPTPKGHKTIGSVWVFKVKPDGLFNSRLCAQDVSQVAGTVFGSTYAPGSRVPRVRIVSAIAASHDWNVIQLNVQTAFLQSEMKEEVYVKQPVRFEKVDLNGQPYVCKQSRAFTDSSSHPATSTELSDMNVSPKDSGLACATHVFTSRMTTRLNCSLRYMSTAYALPDRQR